VFYFERRGVAAAGTGVPVILCHGFPHLWYSWRHQLPALAEAGWRVIAPDLRELVLVPGAGHLVQLEKASEVNAHLLRFLASI
jgi:pimeloyl-ACP methyl ester carboxylesterase